MPTYSQDKADRIELRCSPEEKELLLAAARATRRSLTQYILAVLVPDAERILRETRGTEKSTGRSRKVDRKA